MQKNILVFPCGSEIALEIYRAVRYSTHFKLIGANSVNDHGRFVYEDYEGGLPFINQDNFIPALKELIARRHIDAVYPAMDAVIELLKSHEAELGCKVIAPPAATTEICLAKSRTYKLLKDVVRTPHVYEPGSAVKTFPVFAKPDIGYGSRGARILNSAEELELHLHNYPDCIITEYLPGDEYTVDCFTGPNGQLLFAAPRQRCRVMNGISVNTRPVDTDLGEFRTMAAAINGAMKFCGAWFFQVKRNRDGLLTLLEVASRFGGSSGLFRARGVNFALMSLFTAFDIPVTVLENDYQVEMDRALDNKYKLSLQFNEVFVDFDDCLLLEGKKVNSELVSFLYECINRGYPVNLLSRHPAGAVALTDRLKELRLEQIFDRVIHLPKGDKKSSYIHNERAIFIDDSFAERKDVFENCHIPVFSPDMVSVLL